MSKNISRFLFLFAICFNVVSATQYITSIDQLNFFEIKLVNWIKQWTVPNTRTATGAAWSQESLPADVGLVYDTSIKPEAYAAAIVTAWSLEESIFNALDFYRLGQEDLTDKRSACFHYPAQLPPRYDNFPIEVFTYNFCLGEAYSPDPSTNLQHHDCACAQRPGEMIGPNQICTGIWQNGIFGMEMKWVESAAEAADRAEKIFQAFRGSDYTYVDVIDNTLTVAGFREGTEVYENVMSCFPIVHSTGKRFMPVKDLSMACAQLARMWLIRNHLVALTYTITDNKPTTDPRIPTIQVLAQYFNN